MMRPANQNKRVTVESEKSEPKKRNFKRFLIPGAVGLVGLIAGILIGYDLDTAIESIQYSQPTADAQSLLPPTYTPYPTYTLPAEASNASETDTPEALAIAPTATVFNTPAPTSTNSPTIPGVEGSECLPVGSDQQAAQVVQVMSGDEIGVHIDGDFYTVRYLGVDVPDPDGYTSGWSRSANYELVTGKEVTLIQDFHFSDPPSYLPRYVVVDDVFVNYELLKEGFLKQGDTEIMINCEELFAKTEAEARAARIGVWEVLPTATPSTSSEVPPTQSSAAGSGTTTGVSIVEIARLVEEGGDSPEEYVEIRNNSSQPVELNGWRLSDTRFNMFNFPQFQMQPGQTCRVYTGEAKPEYCGFSFNLPGITLWESKSNCATLNDAVGAFISQMCY